MEIALFGHMEQMKPENLDVVKIDYSDSTVPESVQSTHPVLYIDGDIYCCVLGPNPETGVFGRGKTVAEALTAFDHRFQDKLAHPIPGEAVSEYIQQRHI